MTGEKEKRALLGLWCTPGIGAHAIRRIRKRLPLAQIVDEPVGRWLSSVPLPAFPRQALQLIGSLGEFSDAMAERAAAGGMSVLFKKDPRYPRGLAELRSAPEVLFLLGRGDRPNAPRRLAMVGSRAFE